MMYNIKTIYVNNIIKKNTIRQFVYNCNYKTFIFLSQKLNYQQELKIKSIVIKKLI